MFLWYTRLALTLALCFHVVHAMYDLTGKVALVTGAGGRHGIGRAIALRLAQEGADVAVNDVASSFDPGASWGGLAAVVDEIRALERRALAVAADVADATAVEGMFRRVLDEFRRIDILVNNAASRPGQDRVCVVDLDEAAWDAVQRVNVRGTFLCSRAAAREMIRAGRGGKIINMSSTKGKQGAARHAAYAASKFAVIGFTQSLAVELAPYKINVNAICPGMVNTERLESIACALAAAGESTQESLARMVGERGAEVPLGRIAEGADIARTAAFLASAESDYLTGLAITVSGGTHFD
jgi:NAD(P)-dependent dehydrogenase (short-subunit alcohol dehydrogenase family)